MSEQDYRTLVELSAAQKEINARLERITDDHEKRIRFVERVVGYGLGAVGLAQLLLRH